MNFINSYLQLKEIFYEKIRPTTVANPQLLLWNSAVARQLMIGEALAQDPSALAAIFSGNELLPGSVPVATAYAGHQFGHFVPQLGDGRAHLLGEVVDVAGKRWDIQLKGSGPTSFSRNGDGRCAVGPAVREFIMSEAMHALGVPTTRCLAVVTTGETVYRDTPLPGAVVTRVASSHLRVGTFEYFAARGNHEALKALCRYTIERHYPEVQGEGSTLYLDLLDRVIERQIHLIVEWMRVGFIHGVMNTDNTALSGETIDFGPCAMLGVYNPQTVYSSIDTMGRYAFGNQPKILQWNMSRFGECLLPLLGDNPNNPVKLIELIIDEFPARFEQKYLAMMAAKLGLRDCLAGDKDLIAAVLDRFKQQGLDYTLTFDRMTRSLVCATTADQVKQDLGACFDRWQKRLHEQGEAPQAVFRRMRQTNPVVIPRNHHVEAAIRACEQEGDTERVERFLQVLRSPYEELAHTAEFQDLPADGDRFYRTFCGT
jgi:uncharacterized protein YdiU (UPF0061 family)